MTPGGHLWAAVALGGALGSVARFLVSAGMLALAGSGFPWGTLAVNIAGSFLIGAYAARFPDAGPVRLNFVIAGFCGGFTTFSIFSLETLLMLEREAYGLASLNVGLSLVGWMVAVWAGWRLGRAFTRRIA